MRHPYTFQHGRVDMKHQSLFIDTFSFLLTKLLLALEVIYK